MPPSESAQYDRVCHGQFQAVASQISALGDTLSAEMRTLGSKVEGVERISQDTHRRMFVSNGSKAVIELQAHHEELIKNLEGHAHLPVASKRRVVQIGGGSLAAVLLAILVRVLGPAAGASPEQIEALRRDLLAIAGYKGVAITNAVGMARPIGGGQ